MKTRKFLSLALTLILLFALTPVIPALAANSWGMEDIVFTDTRGNKVTIPGGAASCAAKVVSFTPGSPWTSDPLDMDTNEILGAPDRGDASNGKGLSLGAGGVVILEFNVYIYDGPGNDIYVFEVGNDVEATKVEVSSDLKTWIYVGDAAGSISGVDMVGKVPADGMYKYVRITDLYTAPTGAWPGADIDAVAGINVSPYLLSGWAKPELIKASDDGLIPDTLKGADLTKPITRAEFAGVCVKLYENLANTKVTAASDNPFTDTNNADVLKAYNADLMKGVGDATFKPNDLLNREEAATALTRVLKRAYIPGWTYSADSQYTLNFPMPVKFPDDAKISAWAYSSVYFMAANGIIKGMPNGDFAPRNTTAAETAAGYANNTREQALVIAVRIVDNLKDQAPDYTKAP